MFLDDETNWQLDPSHILQTPSGESVILLHSPGPLSPLSAAPSANAACRDTCRDTGAVQWQDHPACGPGQAYQVTCPEDRILGFTQLPF